MVIICSLIIITIIYLIYCNITEVIPVLWGLCKTPLVQLQDDFGGSFFKTPLQILFQKDDFY